MLWSGGIWVKWNIHMLLPMLYQKTKKTKTKWDCAVNILQRKPNDERNGSERHREQHHLKKKKNLFHKITLWMNVNNLPKANVMEKWCQAKHTHTHTRKKREASTLSCTENLRTHISTCCLTLITHWSTSWVTRTVIHEIVPTKKEGKEKEQKDVMGALLFPNLWLPKLDLCQNL